MKSHSECPASARNELKTVEIVLGGRDRLDFGTVRPRVQIPGPPTKRLSVRSAQYPGERYSIAALGAPALGTVGVAARDFRH